MYGCAFPIAVAEPPVELEGATVEDISPEAVISKPVVFPLAVSVAQTVADIPALVPA